MPVHEVYILLEMYQGHPTILSVWTTWEAAKITHDRILEHAPKCSLSIVHKGVYADAN